MTTPSPEILKLISDELCAKHGFGGEHYPRLVIEQNFSCAYCWSSFLDDYNAWNAMQQDHIYPTSRGGDDTWENAVICCKTCNFLKRAYEPKGDTRDERIADSRAYVEKLRAGHEVRIASLRAFISAQSTASNEDTTTYQLQS